MSPEQQAQTAPTYDELLNQPDLHPALLPHIERLAAEEKTQERTTEPSNGNNPIQEIIQTSTTVPNPAEAHHSRVEISPRHHQHHIDVAKPIIPDIENKPVDQQDQIGEIIEIGDEAISLSETEPRQHIDLARLRLGMRGNDEAVVETGMEADRQAFIGILKDPSHHSREELITSMYANYSGEAYGDIQWRKFSGGWGTESPKVASAYGKLCESHPEFNELALDPGVMTHLPEFMDLLEKGEITATDAVEARDQLKDKLGYKEFWRGTMLTDEEAQAVGETGLLSPLGRIEEESEQPQEQFEATVLSSFPREAIERHFHGEHPATPFLSVSEHRDVAIAVGRHFGNKAPGKNLYLFKVKVPVIDVVSYTDHAFPTPGKLKELTDRNPDYSIKVSVNGEEDQHKWDERVESYVFWKIDPQDILEVTRPEVSESAWNGRVTSG